MTQSFTRSDFTLPDGRGVQASMWIVDDAVRLKVSIVAARGTLNAALPSLRRVYRYEPATLTATIEAFTREFETIAGISVPWTLVAAISDAGGSALSISASRSSSK
jgi:hypothetical protein